MPDPKALMEHLGAMLQGIRALPERAAETAGRIAVDPGVIKALVESNFMNQRGPGSDGAGGLWGSLIRGQIPRSQEDLLLAMLPVFHGTGATLDDFLEAGAKAGKAGRPMFSASKMGSGEGGAAWGRGYYFAENPKVAKAYAMEIRGRGGVMRAELDVDPEDLLDADLPLSQQPPKVKKALEQLGYRRPGGAEPYGRDIYKQISEVIRNNAHVYDYGAASRRLLEAGVPGVRYLDRGSRGGEGTRNVVMFPGTEDRIRVTHWNDKEIE
jgi:hypothetical protein